MPARQNFTDQVSSRNHNQMSSATKDGRQSYSRQIPTSCDAPGERTISESFVQGTSELSPIKKKGEKTDLINVKTVGAYGHLTDRVNGQKIIEQRQAGRDSNRSKSGSELKSQVVAKAVMANGQDMPPPRKASRNSM